MTNRELCMTLKSSRLAKGISGSSSSTLIGVVGVIPFQTVLAAPQMPIKHVVIIFQENHTFDNYFGTYPGANGLTQDLALPVAPGSNVTVAPFHLSTPALLILTTRMPRL